MSDHCDPGNVVTSRCFSGLYEAVKVSRECTQRDALFGRISSKKWSGLVVVLSAKSYTISRRHVYVLTSHTQGWAQEWFLDNLEKVSAP